jgi:hypothetical protein
MKSGDSMLTFDEVLNLNYYKKTSYTGWINGMRFLIKREAPEEGDAFFHAWVWPGPLIFSLTDDSLKTDFTAPFSNEGKQQVVDWINAQYEDHHTKKRICIKQTPKTPGRSPGVFGVFITLHT